MIPKIIHQCHTKGIGFLGEEEVDAISFNRKNNPSWDYRFYSIRDMEDFIKINYDERYINAFNKINPSYGAAKADYFRYLLMYKVGGVYLDTKSVLLKPLDDIVLDEDELVVFSWQDNPRGLYKDYGRHDLIDIGFEYQQWNIISSKNNNCLWDVILLVTKNIENYSSWRDGVGLLGVWKTTGPIPYTNAISNSTFNANIRFAGNNEANGVFYRNDEKYKIRITPNHYSKNVEPLITGNIFYMKSLKCLFFTIRVSKAVYRRVLRLISAP